MIKKKRTFFKDPNDTKISRIREKYRIASETYRKNQKVKLQAYQLMYENAEIKNKNLLREIEKRRNILNEVKNYVEHLKQSISANFEPSTTLDRIDSLFSVSSNQNNLIDSSMPNKAIINNQFTNSFYQNELNNLSDIVSLNQDYFSINPQGALLMNGFEQGFKLYFYFSELPLIL